MGLISTVTEHGSQAKSLRQAWWMHFWLLLTASRDNSGSAKDSFTLRTEAEVIHSISPGRSGRIRFQGTEWPARCELNICLLPGTTVWVIKRQGLIQFVQPGPQ